jgi:hypothetical protein
MGNSSSSVPAVSRQTKQISSDKIRNSIKDMFKVSQNKNISSDATIGFREDSSSLATDFTSSQQGGNTFQSRMNRYDEVLEAINKQKGGNGCGCGNDQYSATSNAQLSALRGGDFESDTSVSSLKNKNDEYSATSNANLSALKGGNVDTETSVASLKNKNESDTSNNPVDYSVLKGGEGEETSETESESESESESDKKKKKHGTGSESESETETDVDIEDDESEEFEDDDATMERIMEDDDSDSDEDISTESSSSTDESSSSSASPIKKIIGRQSRQKGKKKHGKKSKRYARVESSMRSSDVRAVPFYSSENAQSHLQRLQKRNRF